MSLLLGFSTHPLLSIDTLPQSHLQVLNQLHHSLFSCSREILLYIHLTQSHTQGTVYHIDGTLPTRLLLQSTGQNLTEEIEISFLECIRQHTCSTRKNIPTQIILQSLKILRSNHSLRLMQMSRHTDIQFLHISTDGLEERSPIQLAILLVELIDGKLMIDVLWITHFHIAQGSLSQTSLDTHNILHTSLCLLLSVTQQLEHGNYMLLELITDVHCSLIFLYIIILLTQRKTTLRNREQVVFTRFHISINAITEETTITHNAHL